MKLNVKYYDFGYKPITESTATGWYRSYEAYAFT